MAKYTVVQASSMAELIEKVSVKTEKGWKCEGGATVNWIPDKERSSHHNYALYWYTQTLTYSMGEPPK